MGSPTIIRLFDIQTAQHFFPVQAPSIDAFRNIVANKISERLPGLTFGFIEASAGWIPFLIHHLRRSMRKGWKFSSNVDLFKEYRLFVTYEADEDLPYLTQFAGEDNLIIGSDYGHPDASEEPELVAVMKSRTDLTSDVTEKILSTNAREFYALDRNITSRPPQRPTSRFLYH